MDIESTRVDLLGSQVFFRNIVVHNPEDFPPGYVAKIPYLFMDLDLGAFLDGKVRFEKVEVDVGDFQILRLANGRVNWLNLKLIQQAQQMPAGKENPNRGVPVDHFVLTLRRGTYRDLNQGDSPKSFVLDVENQEFSGVRTIADAVKRISREALKGMGLEKMGAGVLSASDPEKA